MKYCIQCGTALPEEARFCSRCGTPQPEQGKEGFGIFLDPARDLEPQMLTQFQGALHRRIAQEHESDKYPQYLQRFRESGFQALLHRRVSQSAARLTEDLRLGVVSASAVQKQVLALFEELLDFFIIRYCQDLNEVPLSEAILKYQGLSQGQTDFFQMILDYLDFAGESETVYTDFLVMPFEKLKNASRYFLFPEANEKILLICDQSIFGSCKEGFALTEHALYWKAHLHKAHKVLFSGLGEIKREKEWITVNGYFFNVNPSLNFKMLKLLKKIRKWYN